MTFQNPREIAFRALQDRAGSTEFIEHIFAERLARAGLRPEDRGLAQELTYGVVRWQATLDWLIARKTEDRPQVPGVQTLLRLGLYQLFWLDRVPDHAAVNEAVALAKKSGLASKAGFVNALLRGYLREREGAERLLHELKANQPALGHSHPDWLFERWARRWGNQPAVQLMEWNNSPPKNFARVNTLRTDAGKLLQHWREQENVEYDFFLRDWTGENLIFLLKSHPPLETLESFKMGWFYVQDPSTLLAVQALNPQPGESVLDLCSAPGGKTAFIAQRMNNQGEIIAQDAHAGRLGLVSENCARLGVNIVQTMRAPENVIPELTRQFDRVLLDAPCSNTGVMRRRVDLRWRIRPGEIGRLRATQLELLGRAAAQVKPGGTLVYSTCSLEPEENRSVVDEFLATAASFKLDAERELLPFRDGVDGAYVAVLLKQPE